MDFGEMENRPGIYKGLKILIERNEVVGFQSDSRISDHII